MCKSWLEHASVCIRQHQLKVDRARFLDGSWEAKPGDYLISYGLRGCTMGKTQVAVRDWLSLSFIFSDWSALSLA